jgi:hypothetical protein
MTCQKCTGLLLSRWDHEVREYETFCAVCAWRPAYQAPKPAPPDNRGRYQRETSLHVCQCGHPKVPWRSRCRGCLDRDVMNDRKRVYNEKTRAVQATRKAFS